VRSLVRERINKVDKHVAVGKKEVLLTQRQFINYWNRGTRRANGNWRSGNWRLENGKRKKKHKNGPDALRATGQEVVWASRRAFHRLHIAVGYGHRADTVLNCAVMCCSVLGWVQGCAVHGALFHWLSRHGHRRLKLHVANQEPRI
jgi:hypothetical protein